MVIEFILNLYTRIICGIISQNNGKKKINDYNGIVFYANHSSHLDFMAIRAVFKRKQRRRIHPVAALHYWSSSILKRYLAKNIFDAILVDRKNSFKNKTMFENIAVFLERGDCVLIFPEGSRNDKGASIQNFKSGIYHLAKKYPETKFVPIYLENMNRSLSKGEILMVPFMTKVSFGESIVLENNETKNEFLKRTRNALILLRGDNDV